MKCNSFVIKDNLMDCVFTLAIVFLLFSTASWSKSPDDIKSPGDGYWVVQLERPGLIDKNALSHAGQSRNKLDVKSRQFKDSMAEEQLYLNEMTENISQYLQRNISTLRRYTVVFNGMALELSSKEVEALRKMPGVKAVFPNVKYYPMLDAGPQWIGAPAIWQGPTGLRSMGEGIVVGVIDGGVNWDSAFFADVDDDGFNHNNPLGSQFELCNQPDVLCNDKLIGVYDFTNEGTNGKDTDGHGTHVASIAVGNRIAGNISLGGNPVFFDLSGVARHANLISYKVCSAGTNGDVAGCNSFDIVAAVEQAILDQVDVINISLGSLRPDIFYPLDALVPDALLNAREVGVVSAVSAGNLGPNNATVATSGNSPWVITAGNITHNRLLGERLEFLTGGASSPPQNVFGAGISPGFGPARIVHASDFGFPLCGVGPSEERATCASGSADSLTGASNPFSPGTFNGQIVVCDRGSYGRVEKGFNVLQAGAGGMILANTDAQGSNIVTDQHCLPGIHIDAEQGGALRNWLSSGSNHQGRISSTTRIVDDRVANRLAISSSRGPNPEIPGIVKPNLVAPGTEILAAGLEGGRSIRALSGTSMSSPHVAGAAALLLGVNPGWTPSQVHSALETTADSFGLESGGRPAMINERGAGRPQLGAAVNAGLYLNITADDFRSEHPRFGGDPSRLNLPGMQGLNCFDRCQFTRRVTDMQGGGSWTVRTEGELNLNVTPSQFTLGNGQSRTLVIEAVADDPEQFLQWVDGAVVLESAGVPAQRLPITVFAVGGELPEVWNILAGDNRGRASFQLQGLSAISLGRWDATGLIPAENRAFNNLPQDPTQGDPYDSPVGVRIELVNVDADTEVLLAQVNQSTAADIDLFVGRDNDGNGIPSADEEDCASISPTVVERCILNQPEPGQYWIVIQNWDSGSAATSSIQAEFAVVPGTNSENFFVNGPGVIPAGEAFTLDIAWDEGEIARNQPWWGAVQLGTDPDFPGNLGVIPVRLVRSGSPQLETTPLFNGRPRSMAIPANGEHGRLFIDVPTGAQSLRVSMAADQGVLELARVPFGQAFGEEPFAAAAPLQRPFSATINNSAAQLTLDGNDLSAGRWYVIPRNTTAQELAVTVSAEITLGDPGFTPEMNNFGPVNRQTAQGVEVNRVGNNYGASWFTYAEDGSPVTYLGAGPIIGDGVVWHAPVNAFVGAGNAQRGMPVGRIGMTFTDSREMIFSYDLMGRSGSELMAPIAQLTCPNVSGSQLNVSGHWTTQQAGEGGTSLLVNQVAQGFLFYFFDGAGIERWLLGNSPDDFQTNSVVNAQQFRGFCPTCNETTIQQTVVGDLSHSFSGNGQAQQTVDVNLVAPLSGQIQLNRALFKITDDNVCR